MIASPSPPTPATAPSPTLLARALAEWPLKLAMLAVLPLAFTGAYLAMQHVSPFEPAPIPFTAVDRAIPFDAQWVWPYASLYVFILLAPLLATSRRQLARYTLTLTVFSLTSYAFFYFLPTSAPRIHMLADPPTNFAYDLILWIDRDTNACPSLHAALIVYTLLFAHHVLSAPASAAPRSTRIALLSVGVAWAILIMLATIGTRQHRFLDLLAGSTLALAADLLVAPWFRRPAPSPPGRGPG